MEVEELEKTANDKEPRWKTAPGPVGVPKSQPESPPRDPELTETWDFLHEFYASNYGVFPEKPILPEKFVLLRQDDSDPGEFNCPLPPKQDVKEVAAHYFRQFFSEPIFTAARGEHQRER